MILAPEGFKYSSLYEIESHVPSRITHSRHGKSPDAWWRNNTCTGTDALMYSAKEGMLACVQQTAQL